MIVRVYAHLVEEMSKKEALTIPRLFKRKRNSSQTAAIEEIKQI
jgi:hypothetical protein